MRIGIIGIGSIAKKAYLPVLSVRAGIDLIPCTRNPENLKEVMAKYHLNEGYTEIEDLIASKLDAVYVTSATEAHHAMVKRFLEAGIPVHVDKPITMDFEKSFELLLLSEKLNVPLMVGFNRRFVPLIKKVRELGVPNHVIYQKNRNLRPDPTRRFVVEDFIHVIDTTRFLLQADIENLGVFPRFNDGLLSAVTVLLITNVNHGICIMDYENGVSEESIEVFNSYEKTVIRDLTFMESYKEGVFALEPQRDWDPTLLKRGFEDMTTAYLDAIENKLPMPIDLRDALRTHEICEKIVETIDSMTR